MKKLACELCGSEEFLKDEGLFVCQTCGCKYTLEEARKLMNDNMVNTTTTVKVDNTDQVKNFIDLLENAFEVKNYKEAETYCNKIIEIDAKNSKAWLVKGKSTGWQSSLANKRIDEAISCFSKAYDYVPDEEKDALKKEILKELFSLYVAIINQSCKLLRDVPTEENFDKVKTTIAYLLNCDKILLEKTHISNCDYYNKVAKIVSDTAWDLYLNYYQKNVESTRFPNDSQYNEYVNGALLCKALLLLTIKLSETDFEENAIRYNHLVIINSNVAGKGGWSVYKEYDYDLVGRQKKLATMYGKAQIWGGKCYYTSTRLPEEKIKELYEERKVFEEKEEYCKKEFEKINDKIQLEKYREDRIRKERRKEKVAAYWAEHPERKKELDERKNELQIKRDKLIKQIKEIENQTEIVASKNGDELSLEEKKKNIEKQITSLNKQLDSLGLFKAKEKKELQLKIDELKKEKNEIDFLIKKDAEEKILRKKQFDLDKMVKTMPYRKQLAEIIAERREVDEELDLVNIIIDE